MTHAFGEGVHDMLGGIPSLPSPLPEHEADNTMRAVQMAVTMFDGTRWIPTGARMAVAAAERRA